MLEKKNYKIFIIFLIQRDDCEIFTIAKDIDPDYAKALKLAVKNKLNILCYDCKFSSKGIKLNKQIKIEFLMKDFKEAFEKTRLAGSIAAGALDEVSKIVKTRNFYK